MNIRQCPYSTNLRYVNMKRLSEVVGFMAAALRMVLQSLEIGVDDDVLVLALLEDVGNKHEIRSGKRIKLPRLGSLWTILFTNRLTTPLRRLGRLRSLWRALMEQRDGRYRTCRLGRQRTESERTSQI